MVTQKQKIPESKLIYLSALSSPKMVVAVIPDILKILTGFRCEFNVFHRQALCLL